SGEVRAVSMPKQRVMEAKKLGFHTCILPGVSVESVGEVSKMKIIGVKNVSEAIQHL
ncbi:MAG TPA: DNA repair protein RadA, partial [Sellimonas intestinalis]|nr:DNA repair protein RadA [Sellimonas intestinalis]